MNLPWLRTCSRCCAPPKHKDEMVKQRGYCGQLTWHNDVTVMCVITSVPTKNSSRTHARTHTHAVCLVGWSVCRVLFGLARWVLACLLCLPCVATGTMIAGRTSIPSPSCWLLFAFNQRHHTTRVSQTSRNEKETDAKARQQFRQVHADAVWTTTETMSATRRRRRCRRKQQAG